MRGEANHIEHVGVVGRGEPIRISELSSIQRCGSGRNASGVATLTQHSYLSFSVSLCLCVFGLPVALATQTGGQSSFSSFFILQQSRNYTDAGRKVPQISSERREHASKDACGTLRTTLRRPETRQSSAGFR